MRRLVRAWIGFVLLAGPVIACGGSAGGGERTGAVDQRVVRCDNSPSGWCAENGTWDGGYNVIDNQCHQAANNGVCAGADGIVSCSGTGPGSGYGGHTLNWSNPEGDTVCLSDPQ